MFSGSQGDDENVIYRFSKQLWPSLSTNFWNITRENRQKLDWNHLFSSPDWKSGWAFAITLRSSSVRPFVVRPLTYYILIFFFRTTETFACWNDKQIKLVKSLHLDEVVRRTLIGVIAPEMSHCFWPLYRQQETDRKTDN